MHDRVSLLMAYLSHLSVDDAQQGADSQPDVGWLAAATQEEVSQLLTGLAAIAPFESGSTADKLVNQTLMHLAWRSAKASVGDLPLSIDVETRDDLLRLYQRMGADSCSRHYLLSFLVHGDATEDLRSFAELISSDPPHAAAAAATVFFPLTRSKQIDASALFPTLLDGLHHVQLAAPILDLANFFARQGMIHPHPAWERRDSLTKLLGTVVGQLGRWEENPPQDNETWQQARDQINEGIALAVSLCDTLSFIGNAETIGKLNQALQLGHRRVRVEAAAALSRLGDANGIKELVQLAAEPVSRQRVLAYAEELELLSKIDDQYTTELSRAEAELVCFLAEPTQFGMPPQHVELVDQRHQYWPGFDDPVECYLFRYEYQLAQGRYSNIGIIGPLVHALKSDLADLPVENIYAAYAGVQAEHEEIYELELEQLSQQQQSESRYLQQLLEEAGYEDIEPSKLGIFFGETVLMGTARKDDCLGAVVADRNNLYWYPFGAKSRPLLGTDAYAIYKGRKMLELFNPGES